MIKQRLPHRHKSGPENRHVGVVEKARTLASRGVKFLMSYLSTPLFALFGELRNKEIHSLLVQEYETARFDLCVLIGQLRGVKVFGTFQGFLPHHFLLRPLRRIALYLCDGLLIPSSSEAQRVKQQYGYPEQRVQRVYTPIDCSVFHAGMRDKCRADLGIERGFKLVIYHGRIDMAYKGLDVLLNAWEILGKNRIKHDAQLLIIGTGPDDAQLEETLSQRNLRCVTWLRTWINDQRSIQQYLASSDIYVFPSRGDACPSAVIEAMACGLPIVASRINGIADIFANVEESGGILVPPGNPFALADSLNYLLDHEDLIATLGKRARCYVEERLSMEVIGNQLKEIFVIQRAPATSATVL